MSSIRTIPRIIGGAVLVLCGIAIAAGAAWYVIDRVGGDDKRLRPSWQRGMNVTAFLPEAYAQPQARQAMLTARAAGTRRVALVPTWYMGSSSADEVYADPEKTPTDASVETAAATARALGLEVVIKPHVDVIDGTFRGEIMPADAGAWFDSYERMIIGYAELADRVDADVLVVGTELTTMSLYPDEWRSIIARIRRVYDGKLTFAANWVDGAESVEFWDDLDLIGIDAYMPLQTPDPQDPSVDELVDAWGPFKSRMGALADRWDEPVVFTELGYQSRVGTATQPMDDSAPVSQQAQADAYEAAFEALHGEDWFRGIWWWDWSAERLVDPGGWSPEDKLAEDVLYEWQGGGLKGARKLTPAPPG